MNDSQNDGLRSSLDSLKALLERLSQKLTAPIELQDARPRLDLVSRRADPTRMAKHIAQMCALQHGAFIVENEIKLAHSIEWLLRLHEPLNPVGVASAARCLLEFNAFLFDVADRLEGLKGDTTLNWREKGEKFFGVIVRARFGTSAPHLREIVRKLRVSKDNSKPISVGDSLRSLAAADELAGISERYDFLCDLVHHNMAGRWQMRGETVLSKVARRSGGGMILTTSPMPVTRYQYPDHPMAEQFLSVLLEDSLADAAACQRSLGRTPGMPFCPEDLRAIDLTTRSAPAAGRNDPCPCGSGRKFKRCCES